MIWEHETKAIVMLTGLIEQGKPKCFRYWPDKLYNATDNLGHVVYGDITVQVLGGSKAEGVLTTELKLIKGRYLAFLSITLIPLKATKSDL